MAPLIFRRLLYVPLGCELSGSEDRQQFVTFFYDISQPRAPYDLSVRQEFQPKNGFIRLLNDQAKFRQKIRSRPPSARCPIVGCNGCG